MSAAGKAATAESKFWNSPDHVEMLLPLLDASSILSLAKAQAKPKPKEHPLIIQVLFGTSNWTSFIKRTCPDMAFVDEHNIGEKKAEMGPVIEVLKIMGKPQQHLLQLLHLLHDRAPFSGESIFIKLTCPDHEAHSVSEWGFCLMEEVEAAMDSSEQKIELVRIRGLSLSKALTSALNSRLLRQEGVKIKMEIDNFNCRDLNDAVALHTFVRNSEEFRSMFFLEISGPIGENGWSELAEACKLPQFSSRMGSVISGRREWLLEGRREDLRAIWDVTTGNWHVGDHGVLLWQDGTEAGWTRLIQCLNGQE